MFKAESSLAMQEVTETPGNKDYGIIIAGEVAACRWKFFIPADCIHDIQVPSFFPEVCPMPDLLLELFGEEIPARMQKDGVERLKTCLADRLREEDIPLDEKTTRTFVTPRRLAVLATGIPEKQPVRTLERKGPRVDAPAKAVAGFLRSAGLSSVDACERRASAKGDYYIAVTRQEGRPAPEVLATLLPDMIRRFTWPRSMRWGSGTLRWVRPLSRILCLYDGAVVDFDIDGIRSGDLTEGHRFMAPGTIRITDPSRYEETLNNAYVVAGFEKRKKIIMDGLNERYPGVRPDKKETGAGTATPAGRSGQEDRTTRSSHADPDDRSRLSIVWKDENNRLLDEVTGLVEWPVLLEGRFDEKFLELPGEVPESVMRGHQKYFPVCKWTTAREKRESGNPEERIPVNRFACVANLDPDKAAGPGPDRNGNTEKPLPPHEAHPTIRKGYERVLHARLCDAGYLYSRDRQRTLASRIPDLDRVTFFEGLGSLGEKAERMKVLAGAIASVVPGVSRKNAEQAAFLAKADLVSDMVREFPELQGIMGGYYARNDGLDKDIATAIGQHYSPFPSGIPAGIVALADRIDTLAALWSAGKQPTGSRDPFALRRAAKDVVHILINGKIRLKLRCDAIRNNILSHLERRQKETDSQAVSGEKAAAIHEDLTGFILDRYDPSISTFDPARTQQEKPAHPLPVPLQTVLSPAGGALPDDIFLIHRKYRAMENFFGAAPERVTRFRSAIRRVFSFLETERKKERGLPAPATVSEDLLQAGEERVLHEKLREAGKKVEENVDREEFGHALEALAGLEEPLNAFLDNVRVNADDGAVRTNRFALLERFASITGKIADFSKLP